MAITGPRNRVTGNAKRLPEGPGRSVGSVRQLFSFSARAPVPMPGTSGGPGPPCPARHSCASALGSLVTREPATNQNKGRGQAGEGRASAGSLPWSAGNACQPSRVAPAGAWRWESDSRPCPLHPRAHMLGPPQPGAHLIPTMGVGGQVRLSRGLELHTGVCAEEVSVQRASVPRGRRAARSARQPLPL